MSRKYPIIAVTGSSGAGTSTVRIAFEHIFRRLKIKAFIVEGDAFHKYNRYEFREKIKEAQLNKDCKPISHFGPEGNILDKLEELFKTFSETGRGKVRKYIHTREEGEAYGIEPGYFTPWEDIPEGTELLFYEGLHGGYVDDKVNIAQYVDLLIGVVPVVNLEWIQKIHRDVKDRGYTEEEVRQTILRRMHDYIYYITPQFSRTDINFQRVPIVDTSNPFIARDIPTPDESLVVIRFREPKKVNFPYLLQMLHNSFMSRPNTIVVPGGKMGMALEIIIQPRIEQLMEERKKVFEEEKELQTIKKI
ncbi:MAG: phosphoribulokinase [Leptospiraceae bacterium]|nr:phosphoribulokinase [Leptospiraceae bacterium]MDW7976588.1 phosphoribulokinase [Leptospiraceae bacterium]